MKGLNLWVSWKYNRNNWKRLLFSAFGVAISFILISSSLFTGDSVENSLIEIRLGPLGELDMQIHSNSSENSYLIDQSMITILTQNNSLMNEIEFVVPRYVRSASVAINEKNEQITNYPVLIGVDFNKDLAIGPFRIDGEERAIILNSPVDINNETIYSGAITYQLAYTLQAEENDTISVPVNILGFDTIELKIKIQLIVENYGKASYYSEKGIFLNIADLQGVLHQEDKITSINIGWKDVEGESWQIRQVKTETALLDFFSTNKTLFSNVVIYNIREQQYDNIKQSAQDMTTFFSALSIPSLASGLVLILVIFYLLVDERRRELSMLKSVGFRWWEIFSHLVGESLVVGTIACLIGIPGGMITTDYMLNVATTKAPEGEYWNLVGAIQMGLDYKLYVTFQSIIVSIILGFLALMIPTMIAAWRLSRMNVASNLHEDELVLSPKRNVKIGVICGIISLFLIGLGFLQFGIDDTFFILLVMIGSLLTYASINFIFQNNQKLPFLWTFLNIIFLIFIFQNPTMASGPLEDVIFSSLLGLVYAIIFACIFAIQSFPFLISISIEISSYIKRNSLAITYALANLRRHRLRTFFIMTIFALVLSLMFSFSAVAAGRQTAIENNVDSSYMGSDYMAFLSYPMENKSDLETRLSSYGLQENLELSEEWARTVTEVNFTEVSNDFDEFYREYNEFYQITGITNATKDNLDCELIDPSLYSSLTETEIWNRVMDGTGVLFPRFYYSYYDMPLTNISILSETNETKSFEVVGFLDSTRSDVFLSKTVFSEVFPSFNGSNILFFKDTMKLDDVNYQKISETKSNLTKALISWGSQVYSREVYIQEVSVTLQGTFSTSEFYLLLGVIIGIVGLTLINSRKIQNSSFEYGVLISYGASKRDFMFTNIIEVTLIISICTVIAYIVPIIFFTPIFPIMVGMDLIMPLDKIIYWTIITFMTALVSSLLPFYKILKLQPTEVFRRAT